MPDIKTFYPGGSSTNPVNNSTASVSATTATNVDDQNSANNALVWTGTAAQYAAIGSKDANTLYFVTA